MYRKLVVVAVVGSFATLMVAVAGAERPIRAPAVTPESVSAQPTGSLPLSGQLAVSGTALVPCPPEAPPEADICSHRTSSGPVRGVGFVTGMYWFIVDDPAPCDGVRPLRGSGEVTVSGKGTIRFELEPADQCFPDVYKTIQPYVITGGSGVYAAATGAGSVNHDLVLQGAEPTGTDTWSGSLDVPGLEFDLTPPTLSGLVNRTIRIGKRATHVRVTYRVTARDVVDGSRPASCQPSSGNRFRVGRTVVKCFSSDLSANTATGSFTVVVKRRR